MQVQVCQWTLKEEEERFIIAIKKYVPLDLEAYAFLRRHSEYLERNK